MRSALRALLLLLPVTAARPAEVPPEQAVERMLTAEKELLRVLAARAPLVETYVQEVAAAAAGEGVPARDHYFLGRLRLAAAVGYEPLVARGGGAAGDSRSWLRWPGRPGGFGFVPRGFAQMAFADAGGLDRSNYRFELVRREFLGEVRCLVIDVAPRAPGAAGRFVGRIWAEDQTFQIVRLNGSYASGGKTRRREREHYFHFDSWRVHTDPGWWVPAYIYVEELGGADPRVPRFKAQTRIWGYAPETEGASYRTSLSVASGAVEERTEATALTPLESQREWERQAEQNVLERLERAGLIGVPGPVEEVLEGVARQLAAAVGLNLEVRCRVLLTTPLESFPLGNTVVLSRGLIDVLPDEGALALVLAGEIAHLALGHRPPTEFAFHNRTMWSDAETLGRLRLARNAEETARAGAKALEILDRSRYRRQETAGLFLRALAALREILPNLLESNLGNRLADAAQRFRTLAEGAPPLAEQALEQIAALPLGSRVQLRPWSNHTALLPPRPLALLNAREKMPFEVTPFRPYLARVGPAAAGPGASAGK
jgi:hypothetical protein